MAVISLTPRAPTTGVVKGAVKLPTPKVNAPTSSSPEKPSTVKIKPLKVNNPSPPKTVAAKTAASAAGKSTAPDWLQPLTQQQITNEATSIVNKEYKPTFSDINNQASQAKALDAKRSADSAYYENWLASQGAALQTANSTMMGSLENANAALAAGAQQGAASANGLMTPEPAGTTSANAALNQSLTSEGLQKVATDTQASNTGAAIDTGELGGSIANAYAGLTAERGTQLTALNTALQGLATTRSQAQQSKIADLAKEINTLQTNEVNKAQSQQTYNEAAAEFGLKAADTNSTIAARAAGVKTAAANAQTSRINAQTSLTRAQQEAMAQDRTYKLDVAKFGAAQAKDAYEKAHQLGTYKPAKGTAAGGPANALSQAGTNSMYNQLDGTRGEIANLVQQHGLTPQQAYQAVRTGGEYAVTTTKQLASGKTENVTTYKTAKQQSNLAVLNAAFALHQTGYLTPAQLKALNSEGLYGVRKRFTIKAPTPNTVRPPVQRQH